MDVKQISRPHWTPLEFARSQEHNAKPLSCGRKWIQFALIFYNIILLLFLGFSVLICAVTLYNCESQNLGANALTFSILVLVLNFICAFGSFFGCCGAIRESKCMLYMYSGYLTMILLTDVSIIIWWHYAQSTVLTGLLASFNKFWMNLEEDPAYLNTLQINLKCCGLNGPDDWRSNILPPSCCTPNSLEQSSCMRSMALEVGCQESFSDHITWFAQIILNVVIIDVVMEFTILVLTIFLIHGIRRTYMRIY